MNISLDTYSTILSYPYQSLIGDVISELYGVPHIKVCTVQVVVVLGSSDDAVVNDK